MIDHNIFCYAGNRNLDGYQQKRYRIFNKEIDERRYFEIKDLINNILKDLKLEFDKSDWRNEWKKVSKEQWQKIAEIPEFDKKIVEKIIGFELDLEEVKDFIKKDGKIYLVKILEEII